MEHYGSQYLDLRFLKEGVPLVVRRSITDYFKEKAMKKGVIILIFIVVFSGCSALKTFKKDYLKGDEMESGTMGQAMKTLKYDYLRATKPDFFSEKNIMKARLIAQDAISATKYGEDYQVDLPVVDKDIMMPGTEDYVFVHFQAKEDKPSQTTYLVVISRFFDHVVYSGVFTTPKGDSFYKYSQVLRELGR